MLARSPERLASLEREIGASRGYAVDVTDRHGLEAVFERIRAELGAPDVLVHNAGEGSFHAFLDASPEALERSFRTNALALLYLGQLAAPAMLEKGRGDIVVIGATASLRGGANFAAFAPAKAAQRSLAQSMARSLGPRGIHVSYVVVDGVIDLPRTRRLLPDRPDAFFLKPSAIAETVYHLVQQDPSAWTFEVDVRPFGEKW